MTTPNSSELSTTIHGWDLVDICQLAHAGLAQDSPNPAHVYLNSILNIAFAYLTADQKKEVEEYILEKKYLPPIDIQIAK